MRRSVERRPAPRAATAPSRSDWASDVRPRLPSGVRPMPTVVSTPTAMTKATVRQSVAGTAKLGSWIGLRARSASLVHWASSQPPPPPSTTSRALSMSSNRTSCRSSAPIARRRDISRRRASPRASRRLATLAQAIRNTRATAPKSSDTAGRTSWKTSAASGETSADRFSLVAKYARSSCALIAVISAWAAARLTSSRRRASTGKLRLPRCASAGAEFDERTGVQTAAWSERPRKPAGTTPTTVNTRASSCSDRPTTSAARPNRSSQKRSPTTATGAAPGW